MNKSTIGSWFCLTLLAAAGMVSIPRTAAAEVPSTINHQGRLYTIENQPINGGLDVYFAIYDDPNVATPIWSEVQSISFEDGYFSISLGDVVAFDQSTFAGSTRYLGIRVGSDPEMSPRARIGSVPYAILANNAIGDITPSTVSINGQTVIDANGQWVGDPTGLMGPPGPSSLSAAFAGSCTVGPGGTCKCNGGELIMLMSGHSAGVTGYCAVQEQNSQGVSGFCDAASVGGAVFACFR